MPLIRKHPLVRIVCNGPRDFQVFDTETGEEILKGMVCAAYWEKNGAEMPRVRLELVSAAIESECELPEISARIFPRGASE